MRVCMIPGDGIGREVIPAAIEVLRATGLALEFVPAEAGWECFGRHGTALPGETLAAAQAADAVLFGAVGSPSFPVPGYRSPIVALRRTLDLYANIRPVSNFRLQIADCRLNDSNPIYNLQSTIYNPVDLVVVRENTEGMYAGRERLEDGGETAIAERVITRRASERIVRAAFELARKRREAIGNRQSEHIEASSPIAHRPSSKVTIVHKANVMRETCGLFRTTALRVAEEYDDVAHEEMLVDNCALQLVQRPQRFDVIVTTNMFGDILSDVASYWGGGLGLAVSANIGAAGCALFEPVHGSAPDIAGKGIANPLAAIGCAALLLDHLASRAGDQASRYHEWAGRIHATVQAMLAGDVRTPDLGGTARTEEVLRALIARLERQPES